MRFYFLGLGPVGVRGAAGITFPCWVTTGLTVGVTVGFAAGETFRSLLDGGRGLSFIVPLFCVQFPSPRLGRLGLQELGLRAADAPAGDDDAAELGVRAEGVGAVARVG